MASGKKGEDEAGGRLQALEEGANQEIKRGTLRDAGLKIQAN